MPVFALQAVVTWDLEGVALGEVWLYYRWEERHGDIWAAAERAGCAGVVCCSLPAGLAPPSTAEYLWFQHAGMSHELRLFRCRYLCFWGKQVSLGAPRASGHAQPRPLAPLCYCEEMVGMWCFSEPRLHKTTLTSETNFRFRGIPKPF